MAKTPKWPLLIIGVVVGAIVWRVLRNPLGITPVTATPKGEQPATTPAGTNAATDTNVPENRGDPLAEAAGVLDQDPNAPVWVPDASAPNGGYWALAGDLASGLQHYRDGGWRDKLFPPEQPSPGIRSGSSDGTEEGLVIAHDAIVPPQSNWEVLEAARVLEANRV